MDYLPTLYAVSRRVERASANVFGAGRVCLLALTLTVAAAAWQGVAAAARHALIVGNGAYGFAPLENPINDARAIAGVLGEIGFEVALLEDAGLAEFNAGVQCRCPAAPGQPARGRQRAVLLRRPRRPVSRHQLPAADRPPARRPGRAAPAGALGRSDYRGDRAG